MTVYGRSDITFVEISGAGHSHLRGKNDKHITITCSACEPELRKEGWVTDERNVELTPDEVRELEDAQQDIARFETLKIAENAREAAAAVRGSVPRSRGSR